MKDKTAKNEGEFGEVADRLLSDLMKAQSLLERAQQTMGITFVKPQDKFEMFSLADEMVKEKRFNFLMPPILWSLVKNISYIQGYFVESYLNVSLFSRFHKGGPDTYDLKKEIVREINAMLRIFNCCILRPGTDIECVLYALPSRNGNGRFTFEDKDSKARHGSYFELKDVLPLKIISLKNINEDDYKNLCDSVISNLKSPDSSND